MTQSQLFVELLILFFICQTFVIILRLLMLVVNIVGVNVDCTVTGNNTFCVSSRINPRHSYTLVANDELDKRHWLQKLHAAVKSQCAIDGTDQLSDTAAVKTRRRSKHVSKTGSSCCEEGDASFSSVSSSSSLMSSFSLNSVSTLPSINKFMSSYRVGKPKDADADSGIVS